MNINKSRKKPVVKQKQVSKKKKKKRQQLNRSNGWEHTLHYKLAQIAQENPEVRLDLFLF